MPKEKIDYISPILKKFKRQRTFKTEKEQTTKGQRTLQKLMGQKDSGHSKKEKLSVLTQERNGYRRT